MHDVFISYRRDRGFSYAKLLREMLHPRGISAYIDLDELRNGVFDNRLLTAIKAIPAFVLILTPGALDNCTDEEDWLTKEIIAAVDSERNIIPVLCDGFTWPKKWDENIHEKVKSLSSYNSIVLDYMYINACVKKLYEYICEDGSVEPMADDPRLRNDVDGFFLRSMRKTEDIVAVNMAFHAGSVWHQNVDRLKIIETLAEAGVQIRVLLNSPEVATQMSKHMRHKLKRYISFEEAISLWRNIASVYDNVKVKVTDIPMFRIQYTIMKRDALSDRMRIKYYTHGVPQIDANAIKEFDRRDYEFDLYREEFEYIWNNTEDPECTE